MNIELILYQKKNTLLTFTPSFYTFHYAEKKSYEVFSRYLKNTHILYMYS